MLRFIRYAAGPLARQLERDKLLHFPDLTSSGEDVNSWKELPELGGHLPHGDRVFEAGVNVRPYLKEILISWHKAGIFHANQIVCKLFLSRRPPFHRGDVIYFVARN